MSHGTDRREIPQRSSRWAAKSADILAAAKLTPNQISVGSVVFAAVGAAALIWSAQTGDAMIRAVLLAAAAACIPLRLLLNMLDGMLAVEKGMSSPVGDIYNELPDRISDVLFLAAAGITTAGLVTAGRVDVGMTLGFLAAGTRRTHRLHPLPRSSPRHGKFLRRALGQTAPHVVADDRRPGGHRRTMASLAGRVGTVRYPGAHRGRLPAHLCPPIAPCQRCAACPQ